MTAARAELVVDLDAITANVREIARRVAPAEVMTVVKADGYGHGLVPVARAARAGGASWLGVAVLEEAVALRAAGDTGRVLTWLTIPGEDYRPVIEAGVDVTAYSVAEVAAISAAARACGRSANLQLKVDTGLTRGGSTAADWPGVVAAARSAQEDGDVQVTGVWSHLACADEPEHPANDAQERAYRQALSVAEDGGLTGGVRHLANSAAAFTRPSARFDLVRVGLASYGLTPAPAAGSAADFGLVPAMTARAQVALVKHVAAGEGVSYGHTYTTTEATSVALLPVGYGDGVPRAASSRAPVTVGGRRRTVSGRVCMDQFVVDLHGDLSGDPVGPGDEVVLFGPGTGGEPTAQEWAEACDTISYEIVTRMGGRFVRRYVGQGGEGA